MSKKKNRSLNVARKRTKRNRNQKSRRKQMAVKKQRWSQNEKSGQERFQEKIWQTPLLLDEPELASITFDPDLMRQGMLDLLESGIDSEDDEDEVDSDGELVSVLDEEAYETIGEKFRLEVLPYLMTPEFVRQISHALKACETRLNLIGQHDKAESAFIAKSLFEIIPPEELAFHPLLLKIGARTLEEILEGPEFMTEERDAVQGVISDVLSFSEVVDELRPEHQKEIAEFGEPEAAQTDGEKDTESDEEDAESEPKEILEEHHIRLEVPPEEASEDVATLVDETEAPPAIPTELSAKALYKNFNGLETRKAIETWDGYQIVKDTVEQVELVHPVLEHYITITSDRLVLQCTSEEQLETAMEALTERCGDALFYLARTLDES